MKVQVTEVLFIEGNLFVDFLSPAGSGNALWVGYRPTVWEELDVEFDLDEIFSWGKSLTSSSRTSPLIKVINGTTHVTAEIAQNADEEWVVLKLEDSMILIELKESITQQSGFVEVRTNSIRLYPTNI